VEDPYSIDLSRRRSILEILRSALDLYWRYPLLFVSLAVGLIATYELAVLLIAGYGPLAQHTHRSLQARIVLELLSFSLIGPLISALHVHAVILIGEGRRPQLIDVALRGLRVLPVVAAAEVVANVGYWPGTTPWQSRESSSRCDYRWSPKRPRWSTRDGFPPCAGAGG
jgi:uncharacterized membrane protein YGL010W